ncbi:peptidylprolyl isomerase [Leuconostoc falkenbergense]|uniref:peptidylprolyl isomerase n=1 Tax=Leuconostoc falkenbergense TaxID=2766470 RepID=UPI0028B0675A|nr:peptidylprolyl isomerase [Leuconostoc falkenbergense]
MKKFAPQIIMAVILVLLIAGIVGYQHFANSSNSATSTTKKDPKLEKVALPQLTNAVSENESEVTLHTSYGDITIKLFNKYAPLAVENFITHAKQSYYNNTIFHRVINNFMIQGGDPNGDGSGGESIWKGKDSSIDSGNGFKNEISTSLYNIRGAVSMANAGADTNGSQFFIVQNKKNLSKQVDENNYPSKIYDAYKKGGVPSLDGDYTVFGQVIKGMSVVDKIAEAKVEDSSSGEASKPVDPVKITNITIIKEAK